ILWLSRLSGQRMQELSKRRLRKTIINRLVELLIVFVGVYSAFVLNARQGHEQQQQRRGQILAYLEKGATASAQNLKRVTADYDRRMNEFFSQLARGEMPELAPISWASSYNANDTTWLLQAGGLELLEIDRKSTRLNSSHRTISYAVFCLKKKNNSKSHRTARTKEKR